MLAPPGARKGTQSKRLSQATGIAHIASGDLLRAEIAKGSEVGRAAAPDSARGDLVPDDVLFDVLVPVVLAADRTTGGYLPDGFPRTMAQALRAAEVGIEYGVSSDAVVYLTAPDEVLIERPPSRAQREGRADDNAEVIRHRLDAFQSQTQPLVDQYRERGPLIEVDAARPEDDVQADLRSRLSAEER